MISPSFLLAVGIALLAGADAHICLLHPNQRGGSNVSTMGNHVCMNPGPACGDITRFPVGPAFHLVGGSGFNVLLQQNLNHYQPGDEGWIDVAWAPEPRPISDDNFTVLARIDDVYEHLQAKQTNYTIPITVPNVDLTHGVLRVRYHPNKPTEPIFRNCADISIKKTDGGDFPVLMAVAEPAQPLLAPLSEQQLVRVEAGGKVVGDRDFEIPRDWRVQSETVSGPEGNVCFVAQEAVEDRREPLPPHHLLCLTDGWQPLPLDFSAVVKASAAPPVVSALTSGKASRAGDEFFAVLQITDDEETYAYTLVEIDSKGVARPPFGLKEAPVSPYEGTFVNFMWVDTDPATGDVFILAGDENSLFALNAVIITFPATGGVLVRPFDNSAFTLTHVHWHAGSKSLLALSPGLFTDTAQSSAWSLVSVDPSTGKVSLLHKLAPAVDTGAAVEDFDADFGGSVHNALGASGTTLVHVLRRTADKTHVVLLVDVKSGTYEITSLQNGVNSAYRISSYFVRDRRQ